VKIEKGVFYLGARVLTGGGAHQVGLAFDGAERGSQAVLLFDALHQQLSRARRSVRGRTKLPLGRLFFFFFFKKGVFDLETRVYLSEWRPRSDELENYGVGVLLDLLRDFAVHHHLLIYLNWYREHTHFVTKFQNFYKNQSRKFSFAEAACAENCHLLIFRSCLCCGKIILHYKWTISCNEKIFEVVKLLKDDFDCGASKLNGHLTCLNEA
jgi:hypothetical protein